VYGVPASRLPGRAEGRLCYESLLGPRRTRQGVVDALLVVPYLVMALVPTDGARAAKA
jgi:hypothetical protein